ncbi:MAG TPA: RNA pseudouridine synthase, partial [Mycoplasmatales bacterium]|nr:RNA pseudouridine synthase [Mycoplasmatales bacterium]
MKKISDYFDIAFENENFIAINKPSNLSTQKNSTYDTSVEEILENYTPFSSLTRFGIVHRLDRDTTGILIIAKNQKYQKRLLSLFKEKKVEKNYLSLNFGKSLNRTGIIKFFLKKHFPNGQKIRMKFGDFND